MAPKIPWKTTSAVVALVAAALAAYVLIESSWIASAVTLETLESLRVGWGMGLAFLISTLLGWLYLKRSFQPFSDKIADSDEPPDRIRERSKILL